MGISVFENSFENFKEVCTQLDPLQMLLISDFVTHF
jgi:hypothetical protein